MNKLLAIKNIEYYLLAAFLVLLALIAVFKDTSNVQSAQPIEISLKPCRIVEGIQVEIPQFKVGEKLYICGKVLSEYLPLELVACQSSIDG